MIHFSAKTARQYTAEARQKATSEILAQEDTQRLLAHVYDQIYAAAKEGRSRCSIRLEENQKSQALRHSLEKHGYNNYDYNTSFRVALNGLELVEILPGEEGSKPSRLGRALIEHLQELGYVASLETYIDGRLNIDWEIEHDNSSIKHEGIDPDS